MIIECKNCGGKGHVFDAGILFLGPVGWIMAIAERNSKNATELTISSRDICDHCDGEGYVYIDDNKLRRNR
jgi:DnaJ-class molecular chaperone